MSLANNNFLTVDETKQNLITIEDLVKKPKSEEKCAFEDSKITNALFSDYIMIDVACSCLTFLGVIITVVEYDLEFDERNKNMAQTLCYFISATSVALIVLTWLRFHAFIDWQKARQIYGQKENIFTTGLIWSCLAEMLLVLVGPIPWIVHERIYYDVGPAGLTDCYYHINEILSLIQMIRVLLIFRTLLMLSQWYNNRSQRICKLYSCDSDILFVIKCTMKEQPYTIVSIGFFCSLFYFSFLIRVCESPLIRQGNQDFHSYYNSIWNMIITMTTVGYGDYYAQTHLGRFIIFIVSIWGTFIISMMVVTMTNTLDPDAAENRAIAVLQRLFVRDKMKDAASTVLTTLAKMQVYKVKCKKQGIEFEKKSDFNKLVVKLGQAVSVYKIVNRQYRAICDENIQEEMSRQFELMRQQFQDLFFKQQMLLEANIDIMEHLQMNSQQIGTYKKLLINDTPQKIVNDNNYYNKKLKSLEFIEENEKKIQLAKQKQSTQHQYIPEDDEDEYDDDLIKLEDIDNIQVDEQGQTEQNLLK
ncbi:hypothetical protein PPERSA_07100 [Pseudocohnilembus persalinus]|uniref:Potassium channel domain-containing protein n=1 Tax=Pseudocohnilembus persalinus TaxID=266149 RepID=A0A0V0QX10_PSEPJ|nr:hypothetical protein PPERSA_07100 [Pseudocohnilembus persalinus]|eukprot:KRX06937.1 hypothetical protein PPERSA_07100 [Pseudocohnilembus persalinus]